MEKASEKKNMEFFETWMKLQKEFLDNWTKSQKEFMENWMEASKKLQESFSSLESGKAGAPGKDVLGMYNTWFNSMADSSRIFTDEAMKMQEVWKTSVEKQMVMGKEMFKNFSESSRPEAGK